MIREVTRLRVGAKKDPGSKRDLNEDDFIIENRFNDTQNLAVAEKKGNLYIVADGVGGHNAGEVASRLAVDTVSELYYEDDSPQVEDSLCRAIRVANARIHDRAKSVHSETGMGSTIVAAVIRGDELFVAHAGDSRAYLIRGGQIEQLTADHSWVSEQMARGLMTEEDARTHPYRSYITRSLGNEPQVKPDCVSSPIHEGDVVLLCSDGLSGPVDDETIRQAVLSLEPEQACEELVMLANEAGGPDNITAVVIRAEKVVPTLPEYGGATAMPAHGARPTRQDRSRTALRDRSKTAARDRPWTATQDRPWTAVQDKPARVAARPGGRLLAAVGFVLAGILFVVSAFLLFVTWSGQQALNEAQATIKGLEQVVRDYQGGRYGDVNPELFLQLQALAGTELTLPVATPTETSTPPAIQIPTPTVTAVLTQTPAFVSPLTQTATHTSTLLSTNVVTPTPWVETKMSLHVRTGPGRAYSSLGVVPAGTTFSVLGYDPVTGWLKVCCVGPNQDTQGWLTGGAGYVELSVPRESLSQVSYP